MGFSRKHLIYGAITFVSLLGAILKITVLRSSAWTAYLAVMYVTFLLWAIGELRKIEAGEQSGGGDLEASGGPQHVPAERRLTEEMLVSADTYLGESLDTVCMFVEPRYRDWTGPEKRAFRQSLRAALDARRANSSEAGGV